MEDRKIEQAEQAARARDAILHMMENETPVPAKGKVLDLEAEVIPPSSGVKSILEMKRARERAAAEAQEEEKDPAEISSVNASIQGWMGDVHESPEKKLQDAPSFEEPSYKELSPEQMQEEFTIAPL